MKENLSLPWLRISARLRSVSSMAFVCTALTALPFCGWATATPAVKCIHKPGDSAGKSCISSKEAVTVWGKRAAFVNPTSITHVSAQDMQAYRMQTLGDIAERVPNLSFTNTTPNNPVLMVRGLGGTEDEGPVLYTPVLIDGIPVPSFAMGQMFDFSNVDIMRGPQLTQGINAFGGMVSAQSRDPGNRLGGSMDFEYGTGNRKRATFSGDLPIDASTSLRLSVGGETADGYIHNRALNRSDTGAGMDGSAVSNCYIRTVPEENGASACIIC